MHENGNEQPKVELWWGVQCRNQNCNKVFAIRLGEDKYPTFKMTRSTIEEKTAVVEKAAIAIEEIVFRTASWKDSTNIRPDDNLDVGPLLQLCPHCGRMYFYTRRNFFLTQEPIPTAQKRA